jgi:hypothetical protein
VGCMVEGEGGIMGRLREGYMREGEVE